MDDDNGGGYRHRGNGRGGHNGGYGGGNGRYGGNGNGGRGSFDRGGDRGSTRRRDSYGEGEPPRQRQRYDDDERGGGGGRRGGRGGRGGRREERPERPPDERFDYVETRDKDKTKQGGSGRPLPLVTNYFHLKQKPAWKIYHYHVSFQPDERFTRFKLILLNVHWRKLGVHVFDGSSLWTFAELSPDDLNLESSVRRGATDVVNITIKKVGELECSDVQCIQVYNVIMRRCFEILKLEPIGRNYYDNQQAITLPRGQLELWPGYITTIRNYEHGLMLNVEICHRLLRQDTALDIIRNCHGGPDAIKRELIGSTVITRYNRKTYRIDDVAFDKSPASTFLKGRDKVETSYADYYQQTYPHDGPIRDMDQPLLGSRPKKKDFHRGKREMIYLIPEKCQMTGLTDQIRSNFDLMKEMGQYTHQDPNTKHSAIQDFMNRLNGHEEITEYLRSWGLKFTTQAVELQGRNVPLEKVQMERDSVVTDEGTADFTVKIRDKKMCVSKKLVQNWILIVPVRDQGGIDNLVRTMNRAGGPLGFVVSQPLEIFPINQPNPEAYAHAIRQATSNYKGRVELIFVVLPNNRLELYSAVKRECNVSHGIASQCFLGKNVNSRGLMSIATKVVIQMNAKLGGEPWRMSNPFKSSHTMLIGYDLHHCGRRRGSSVGAMVASTNQELSKYYSTLSTIDITRNRDFSETMCSDLTKCLDAFSHRNDGALPDRIFFYRDGVGEGMLKYVFGSELEGIKTCIADKYQGKEHPKLTFIVVTKRTNTRLFLKSGRGLINPSPGTVCDDVITHPERYDFYLISQNPRQGTVSPTCYNVIYDQQGLEPDRLQRFTYKLTHLYYNWSGTVSVPAVCQYAHKLSYLAGVTGIGGLPIKERLCDYLYYL